MQAQKILKKLYSLRASVKQIIYHVEYYPENIDTYFNGTLKYTYIFIEIFQKKIPNLYSIGIMELNLRSKRFYIHQ